MINQWKCIAAVILGLMFSLYTQVVSANKSPKFSAADSAGAQTNTEGDQISIVLWFFDTDVADTLTLTDSSLLPGLTASDPVPEPYPKATWWSVTISGTLAPNSATSLPTESSVTVSDGIDSVSGSVTWQVIDGNVNPLDDKASIVHLRTECGAQENCFVNIGELETWINTVRIPTKDSPLLVEVGPGRFAKSTAPHFRCNTGNITFRGSGRENTTIGSATIAGLNGFSPAFFVDSGEGCFNLVMADLTLLGPMFGTYWLGAGSSTWWSVNSIGGSYGWSDFKSCSGAPTSTHFWYNSRIIGRNSNNFGRGYSSNCADNWFFASEITGEGAADDVVAIKAYGDAKFHIYGSNLNAIASPGATFTSPGSGSAGLQGVLARDNAEVHLHGSGIDVIGEATGNYGITGIRIEDNARVHANETAYNLIPPAGQEMHRLLDLTGSENVSAPYLWKPASAPPAGLVSQEGADMFVETDCTVGGCTETGSETHLLIYNSNCETVTSDGGPWFDVVTAKCRGE